MTLKIFYWSIHPPKLLPVQRNCPFNNQASKYPKYPLILSISVFCLTKCKQLPANNFYMHKQHILFFSPEASPQSSSSPTYGLLEGMPPADAHLHSSDKCSLGILTPLLTLCLISPAALQAAESQLSPSTPRQKLSWG